MEEKIVGYIPRLLFRIYLNLKERFDPKPPLSNEEKYCVEICDKLINNPNSKLTYAPLSGKRFIKFDEQDMFIVIDGHSINLINHVYSYNVYIQDTSTYNKIVKNFDSNLESRREEMETEIKSNIQHSLKNILEKIS